MATVYAAGVLRRLVVKALCAANSAGSLAAALQGAGAPAGTVVTIDSPGDTATAAQELPKILVRSGRQVKRQKSNAALMFASVIELALQVQLEAEEAEAAQAQIEKLGAAIESALLTDPDLVGIVEEWLEIREEVAITSGARQHNAELTIGLVLQVTEGPNWGITGVPLQRITVNSPGPNPDGSWPVPSLNIPGLAGTS